jgi:hypothetical protein
MKKVLQCSAGSPRHPLEIAESPTLSRSGLWVYVRCPQCGAPWRVAVSVWDSEQQRRHEHGAAVAWTALGRDRWGRSAI